MQYFGPDSILCLLILRVYQAGSSAYPWTDHASILLNLSKGPTANTSRLWFMLRSIMNLYRFHETRRWRDRKRSDSGIEPVPQYWMT